VPLARGSLEARAQPRQARTIHQRARPTAKTPRAAALPRQAELGERCIGRRVVGLFLGPIILYLLRELMVVVNEAA
jgi:hypothetical protein